MMRRMMITSAVFLAVLLPSVAQQVGNAPLREYMRPSLTAVYINRGEPLSERIIRQMIAKGVPGKFDDNSIEQNILTVDREQTLTPEAIRRTLESDVSREVIRRWFPAFDAERGGFTTAVLAERGLNDATDTDVTIARASNMGEEILKDRGMELIGRSYILVYDFRNTEQTGNGQDEGYRTDCDVYLYHLDWSEETKNAFYARFNSPDGIDESHFPVRHIASFVGESELTGISISQSARDNALRLSDEQLFAAFAAEIRKKADVYLTQASEDFRVKSEIYAVHPLRAKIGVKEGVTVDQRYFV
ncbi:MAG: hypothetical protein LBJ01_09520, partial [Tannerella sp.]|nr:hypothetical protein [Tannerella sp.]